MKTNERMKTKNHDELDADNSLFAAAGARPDQPFSKTTSFADISVGVGDVCER